MRRRGRDETCATCMWYRAGDEGLAFGGRVLHACAIEGEGHDRGTKLWMPPEGRCVMWDEREARHGDGS